MTKNSHPLFFGLAGVLVGFGFCFFTLVQSPQPPRAPRPVAPQISIAALPAPGVTQEKVDVDPSQDFIHPTFPPKFLTRPKPEVAPPTPLTGPLKILTNSSPVPRIDLETLLK